MADVPRQLQVEDFLRQQGIVTTGLTGIPYTPGSQVTSATRQPSVFENFFGTGSATGSFFGSGTNNNILGFAGGIVTDNNVSNTGFGGTGRGW
jgi:hypothetical protein